MIVQKGPPRLRWRLRMMDHVLCNYRLGDVNAEHLQLAVNPRCTPANVVARHCPDKFAHLGGDGWTPTPAATGLPGPVQSKALAMPAHQGIRFEDLWCLQATWPQAVAVPETSRNRFRTATNLGTRSSIQAPANTLRSQMQSERVSFIIEKGKRAPNYTDWMKHRVDSPKGKQIYSHRMSVVEPVFGNIGTNKGLRRFGLRGKKKVQGQWRLYCLVHNIEKLANYGRMVA